MQETVTNTNERKSLFSAFLEVLDAREKQDQADRQLQEEKYQRRTQKIYDFHERQQREAAELRRCLDYVSQHAHLLESVLRGAGGAGGEGVPLSGALVRQAAALQRCMAECVANAARIRCLLTAAHRPQMDSMLAKMFRRISGDITWNHIDVDGGHVRVLFHPEAELSAWTAFVQRAVEASCNTESVIDNLHNLVAEQKRCVREVSASSVFTSLCGASTIGADTPRADDASETSATEREPRTPVARRAVAAACSTPIALD